MTTMVTSVDTALKLAMNQVRKELHALVSVDASTRKATFTFDKGTFSISNLNDSNIEQIVNSNALIPFSESGSVTWLEKAA